MSKGKLNLPSEYKKWPEYFDALNISDDTETKNHVIETLLKRHKVHTVLDLTCGTGSQVFFLNQLGYQVTGADFSEALLSLAREKAQASGLAIPFIKGDMRTLKVGKFDAVITIFNAIGHVTKAGFEKTLRNIAKNVKENGVYMFDIFNAEAMTESAVDALAMEVKKQVNGTEIHTVQHSTFDKEHNRLTSYTHLTLQKNSDKPQIYKEKFSLQLYTAKELQAMLARNGFEVLSQHETDGSPLTQHSLTILTVAKKCSAS